MIVKIENVNFTRIVTEEFESINELCNHMVESSSNFKGRNSSNDGSYYFTGTSSFEEALRLLKYGDTASIDKIQDALKLDKNYTQAVSRVKNEYNVHGYQASVPRYLQGVPTSMINQKKVQQKQKVINIVKMINYNASVDTDTIIENAKKAIQIIQLVESKGYRVNLKVMSCGVDYGEAYNLIVQVKHSSENLNIAKLAFALANPSMNRRMKFRCIEVNTNLEGRWSGYGNAQTWTEDIKRYNPTLGNAYILPQFIKNVEELIESWKLG